MMDTCFENTAELIDFYHEHDVEIAEKYKNLIKVERIRSQMRLKSYAYFAIMDFIYENDLVATDCQINKLAEMLVLGMSNRKELRDV